MSNDISLLNGEYKLVRINKDDNDPIYATIPASTAEAFRQIEPEYWDKYSFFDWCATAAFYCYPNRPIRIQLSPHISHRKVMTLIELLDRNLHETGVGTNLLMQYFQPYTIN